MQGEGDTASFGGGTGNLEVLGAGQGRNATCRSISAAHTKWRLLSQVLQIPVRVTMETAACPRVWEISTPYKPAAYPAGQWELENQFPSLLWRQD